MTFLEHNTTEFLTKMQQHENTDWKAEVSKLLDLSALEEIFLLDNTAPYLYKTFRRTLSIHRLSREFQTDQLISLFEGAVRKIDNSLRDAVLVYSIVIALTLKDYSEVRQFFAGLDGYDFRWSEELKGIFMCAPIVVGAYRHDDKYRVKTDYSSSTKDSGDTSATKSVQPKIDVREEAR